MAELRAQPLSPLQGGRRGVRETDRIRAERLCFGPSKRGESCESLRNLVYKVR